MSTFARTDTFFMISSVGFIILGILGAIFLIYLIRTMHSLSKIMKKLESDIDDLSDSTKDLLSDIKESAIFRFLFKKRKKKDLKV